MWRRLGQFILQYRFPLLLIVIAMTGLMAYWAKNVQLSYDFAKAIPTSNPKYRAYQDFKKKFGEDGNLVVIGLQTDSFFTAKFFSTYVDLYRNLKNVTGVDDVIAVPGAVNLVKNAETEKLRAEQIFPDRNLSQVEIDSLRQVFLNLPFYRGLLYNPTTNAWLMGVRVNKDILNSSARTALIDTITVQAKSYSDKLGTTFHLSGLPLIRTELSTRIAAEMRIFLLASVVLSAIILLVFFRSVSSMLLSLAVVIIGVLWSLGTMHLLGYKITLLTALIPPLIVVIGIPNCIYFLNKFHTSWNDTGDKKTALVTMVDRMGIVTLFCNLAAAIG